MHCDILLRMKRTKAEKNISQDAVARLQEAAQEAVNARLREILADPAPTTPTPSEKQLAAA